MLVITAVIILLKLLVKLYRHRFCGYRKQSRNSECDGLKNSIYDTLKHFDPDDIDLRRAPTGGWHGTYVNKLADGVNEFETITRESKRRKMKSTISPSRSFDSDDTCSDDDDGDDCGGRRGVDDKWMRTRLTRLGSSRAVMESLFPDSNNDHIPPKDFSEKAEIGFV